jgi:hypothetical protein
MSDTNLVRPSRDGDQFHYHWAARRCLSLLAPDAALKAVTIEGPSQAEALGVARDESGDDVIDVAEYYGSEILEQSTLVRYTQLKHSTLQAGTPWPPSGFEKTFRGFAARFTTLRASLNLDDLAGRIEFRFVSNRPIDTAFLDAVREVGSGNPEGHATIIEKLRRFTGLSDDDLAAFCKLIHLDGGHEGLWDQRNLLQQDVRFYLPDGDVDAPLQLKELVTRKALSENEQTPAITRTDVLRAFKTDEGRMYPARCLVTAPQNVVPREQEPEIWQALREAEGKPLIIHAAGGVGKSVVATRIGASLPEGSWSVLYDCFGNGEYRSASHYRHRHREALVQIANELAAKGLCHPLIPTPHAEAGDYVRAFLHRLSQSITSLRSRNPEALLCIVIDAADNSQMAADEVGDKRSFAKDLIREALPAGTRLIALSRTHRVPLLEPPPEVSRLELRSFSRNETAICLRQLFENATEQDVEEFHRLSSQNPRVQALALSRNLPIGEMLRSLGPNPTTVDDTIKNLLLQSIAKLRDAAGAPAQPQIDRICEGLAVLRPLVPIAVLVALSGVDEAAIKSFALDLGRPLLVSGSTIQFLDEPTETWFRERYKPTASSLRTFVAQLKPLADTSAYVAAVLPQLLLEAGQLDELVALALSSNALPEASPVERRDIALQRLQFALKAALRAKRYEHATRIALKAGGESAGDQRQRKLLGQNTDLAARFLGIEAIQELVSRRTFGSRWLGSHNAYEAAVLSEHAELLGDARSRLRMAYSWLRNWSQLSEEERRHEELTAEDVLQIATASFHIHGAQACVREFGYWRRGFAFRVCRMLVSRLIDHGRYEDIDKLATAARTKLCLSLAIVIELRTVHRNPPRAAVTNAIRLLRHPRVKVQDDAHRDEKGTLLQAITAVTEAASSLSVSTKGDLAAILQRYLPSSPPQDLGFRHNRWRRATLLRAYALWAALSKEPLVVGDLAGNALRTEMAKQNAHSESRELRDFRETVATLLPWHRLRATSLVDGPPADGLANAIAAAKAESQRALTSSYREEKETPDEIASLWFEVQLFAGTQDGALLVAFEQWIVGFERPPFTPTLAHLSRLAAHSTRGKSALALALRAFDLTKDVREDADSKSEMYLDLARATLVVSVPEATAYFEHAVLVASKIGDENLTRWGALLDLADRVATDKRSRPELAYGLARCAELIYDYVVRDKHFDWSSTVKALAGLCARSSLTILSRWRDRNFGWSPQLLPTAAKYLVARGMLDPLAAAALVGFRAYWDEPALLEPVLASSVTADEKRLAVDLVYRYMTLRPHRVERWRELRTVLNDRGMLPPDLDARIELSDRAEQSKPAGIQLDGDFHQADAKPDIDAIFDNVDLSSTHGIAMAYGRLDGKSRRSINFFREACSRVPAGQEASFIDAFADVAQFNLYHLGHLIGELPKRWETLLAVAPAIARALKIFCERYCMSIGRSRYYDPFPWKVACRLSGVSESQVAGWVLTAVGEAPDGADANRLFSLVGLLTLQLTEDEAARALSFGLDLLAPELKDADSDGPWSPQLEPPLEIERCVAGYVWSCLGAPEVSIRWEAAHVVRALCLLSRTGVVAHLVSMGRTLVAVPFVDARLTFYGRHAQQWLLMGLARAAKERPAIVAAHADFLMEMTRPKEPNVALRQAAKRALLSLTAKGVLQLDERQEAELRSVNVTQLPVVESKAYTRYDPSTEDDDGGDNEFAVENEDRYYFGIDFGPYWLEPMARAFATSRAWVEAQALRVVRIDWGYKGDHGWREDERHKRQIFEREATYHSHGSFPRADDLSFYLCYHAMMVTAGKLLAKFPVHRDPDDTDDEFQQWLARHDLARSDGGWIADRRDPTPLEGPEWKNERADEWWWTLRKGDFDRVLVAADGRINLWGDWTWVDGERTERIHIRSALVSTIPSTALMMALQSTENPRDFRLPHAADEDAEIDEGEFQLKGWVNDRDRHEGLDSKDPWAGSIPYPPFAPAQYVTDAMGLEPEGEQRSWVAGNPRAEVLWSQVWETPADLGDHDEEREGGRRFQGALPFVATLLRKLNMNMIIEVEIERRASYGRRGRSKEHDFGFIPPSTRLFIFKPDGRLYSL